MSYIEGLTGVGLDIHVEAILGDYQGDIVLLVADHQSYPTRFGFVVIGYGSCSGCDAWEAATSPKERLDIISGILDDIRWFALLDEAKSWVAGEDHGLQWYGHEAGWEAFRRAVAAAEPYQQTERITE